MIQKTKYLTIDTHSRASKWGYGSVLLRLGGVRSQRPNRLQKNDSRDIEFTQVLQFLPFLKLSVVIYRQRSKQKDESRR